MIAPYATGARGDGRPAGARPRTSRGWPRWARSGRYGFYEALDFTPPALPEGETVAIVRSFMAHHQGMTIVAIANALQDGRMRDRFHGEPMIQASELLLQERMPRDVAVAPSARRGGQGAADRARLGRAGACAAYVGPRARRRRSRICCRTAATR